MGRFETELLASDENFAALTDLGRGVQAVAQRPGPSPLSAAARGLYLRKNLSPAHCWSFNDNPPHGGITAQTVGVVHVIVPAKTAKNGLAELPDHAMPPVLAGTAILEKALGNPGQAKGIVKLPVGEQSGV